MISTACNCYCKLKQEWHTMNMLCANHGYGQSMDCAAQSMDLFAQKIHRSLAHSIDSAKWKAQSMDSDNQVILHTPYGKLIEQAGVAGMNPSDPISLQNQGSLSQISKLGKKIIYIYICYGTIHNLTGFKAGWPDLWFADPLRNREVSWRRGWERERCHTARVYTCCSNSTAVLLLDKANP